MPTRFVILEHDHPSLHWDLMLEVNEVLWTWRLDALPQIGSHLKATRLPDHRLLYLDYEGPVSGGRGVVRRWDRGECSWLEGTPASLRLFLRGSRFDCFLDLQHVREGDWMARFHPAG